jgi:hypothetical protein
MHVWPWMWLLLGCKILPYITFIVIKIKNIVFIHNFETHTHTCAHVHTVFLSQSHTPYVFGDLFNLMNKTCDLLWISGNQSDSNIGNSAAWFCFHGSEWKWSFQGSFLCNKRKIKSLTKTYTVLSKPTKQFLFKIGEHSGGLLYSVSLFYESHK